VRYPDVITIERVQADCDADHGRDRRRRRCHRLVTIADMSRPAPAAMLAVWMRTEMGWYFAVDVGQATCARSACPA
jgi:hypothetical protein